MDIKPNELYVISNLDLSVSASNRCCMVRGHEIEKTLKAFKWANYEFREVGIPKPITREPTASEKSK